MRKLRQIRGTARPSQGKGMERMNKAAGYLGAAILAAWGTTACALGLGDINVSSALNQRFHAVIPLTSATPDELQTLQVQIASNDEFAREGIERGDYLSSLSFEVITEGQPRIVISSPQIAQDPALTFIVDAHWAGGRLLKEYTALLDLAPAEPVKTPGVPSSPASLAPTPLPSQLPAAAPAPSDSTPPPAPVAKPAAKPTPKAAPRPKPATPVAPPAESAAPAPAAPATPAVAGANFYGPVQPQETLWHIASKVRPDVSVSMDQTMAALYSANPSAFHNGLNVIKGARLRVPSLDEIRANSPADATRALDQLRHGGKPTLAAAAAAAAPAAAAEEPPAAPKPVKPAKTPVSKPAPAPKPAPVEIPAPTKPARAEPVPPPAAAPQPVAPPAQAPAPAAPPAAASSAASAPAPAAQPAPPAASTAAPAPAASAPAPAAAQPPVEAPKQQPLAPPPAPESGSPIALIGGLGALAAMLVGGLLLVRSNRAKKAAAQKAASSRSAPPKFEPARMPEPAPEPEPEPVAEPEAPHDQTSTLTQDVALDATATMEQPSITIDQAPASDKEIDFDITSQIEAQTVPISLEANDPISEADFHLAYGLYDEAILLLKEAIQKDPARNELRIKLAETYFAAGRPLEFQESAEPLKGKIAAADWQKLAIMGRQICPDSPVFQDEAPAADAATLDFAFSDEPATAPAVPDVAPAPASAGMTPGNNVIDFDADSLSTGRPNSLVGNMADKAPGTAPSDIDLSQFDLNNEPGDGEHPAAKAPAADGSVEFNLDELDLGKPNAFMPSKPETADTGESLDFGDEVSTKLDLARAYVDMGDNEAARSLLNEVLAGGNGAQKQEAESLLKRLTG